MGGIGDFLFGEKPSASQPVAAQPKKVTTWEPEQMDMFKNLLGIMGTGPGSPFSTGFTGGYSPLEQSSIGMLEKYMSNIGGFDSPELKPSFDTSEYFEQIIKKPLMKTWEEEVMPTIGGEFGTKGLFYGSGRREAELKSAESLMDILSRGKIETEKMGREMSLQEMLGVGGLELEQRGMGLQEILGAGGMASQMGALPFQRIMQMLGINPNQYITPTTIVDPGQQGIIQQILGGSGPIMQGLGAMGVSDKRLKKNLIKIGSIKDVPFYIFQYIWDKSKWNIGTTAQDIIKKHPKSVLNIGKYFAVNYERLIGELNGSN